VLAINPARQVVAIGLAPQLQTFVGLAGQGLKGMVEKISEVLQIDLRFTSNGGW
jgi:hypothetical protein